MGSRIYEYYKDKFEIIGIDKLKKYNIKYYDDVKELPKNIALVIDFSDASIYSSIEYLLKNNYKVISGTTNYTLEQIESLKNINPCNFYHSFNFSKGINIFKDLIKKCNDEYILIDFVEIHQKSKKDSPSGTARMLAKEIDFDVSKIQSLRINLAKAIHMLIFSSDNERIIISHEVLDPLTFVEGIDLVVKKILGDKYVKDII